MKSNEALKVALEAALKAGEMLRKKFGTTFEISSKSGCHNLVTECDKAAEKIIIETIHKIFPDHAILAEESGASAQKNRITWIIDPLDGTVNFAHTIPTFCVSIAAAVEAEIVAGVIYQPITNEIFTAERGKGAFLNDKKIKVSDTGDLQQAIVSTGFPYNLSENPLNCIESFIKIAHLGIPIRRLGSGAIDLAYVAAGRFDAFWEVTLQPWDFAAAQLLIQEAGGKITDYKGNPHPLFTPGPILASNGKLHQPMSHILCS